jgi:hypothetical protein
MKTYSIPSITSLDSSKLHFFKNQATCDPLTILNGQQLSATDSTDCGFVTGTNEIELCLSGPVADVGQFEGLILENPQSFGGQMVIANCTLGGSTVNCLGGVLYTCTGANTIPDGECVFSINCPDGTLISECQTLGGGCFSN